MNNLKLTLQSITYIITGELLQLVGVVGDTWIATITALFGIGLFFSGLSKLKQGLDAAGQSGVGWLIIASIAAFVGGLIDLIPLMGVFSSLLFVLSFIFHIMGFSKLSKSTSIGSVGKSGIKLLYTAMVLAIIGALFGIIPFAGPIMGGIAGFGALVSALFGWLRIQEGIIEQRLVAINPTITQVG
jgi:hypothetical protein